MKYLFLALVVVLFSSCANTELCGSHELCESGYNVVVINHTLAPIQLTDDQGNPLQKVNPLSAGGHMGSWVGDSKGNRYDVLDQCGCSIHHVHGH